MNQVEFKNSINDSVKLLKDLGLFKGTSVRSIGDHSAEFKKVSRTNKHTLIYKVAIENGDYEILLFDDSMFQFSFVANKLRYAFIQNPIIFASREDFVANICSPDELLEYSDEELENFKNSIDEEEYEQFLNEQELNLTSHIIRYDLDNSGYKPLIHSCSHLHIGLNQNFRLPCSKLLTPLNFVLFAIKHTYYSHWETGIGSLNNFEDRLRESKRKCVALDPSMWNVKEELDLYLV